MSSIIFNNEYRYLRKFLQNVGDVALFLFAAYNKIQREILIVERAIKQS